MQPKSKELRFHKVYHFFLTKMKKMRYTKESIKKSKRILGYSSKLWPRLHYTGGI